jgi:hypothetical protein
MKLTFDFEEVGISEEEMAEAYTAQKGGFITRPGLYRLRVTGIEYQRASKYDPTWAEMKVSYATDEGETINEFLRIPTVSCLYGDKKLTQPFKDLQNRMVSWGHPFSNRPEIESACKTCFGGEDQSKSPLIGTWFKAHIDYVGKYTLRETDNGSFAIFGNGKQIKSLGEFDSDLEAEIAAKEFPAIKKLQKYTSVVRTEKDSKEVEDEVPF